MSEFTARISQDFESLCNCSMAQLMAQHSGSTQAPVSAEDQQQQEEQRQAAEEQRRGILFAVMQPAARERLSRISLVKPDKARAVEDMLITAAKRGQIGEKVSEDRLIDLLEQVNERMQAKTKVTIQRRRAFDDD